MATRKLSKIRWEAEQTVEEEVEEELKNQTLDLGAWIMITKKLPPMKVVPSPLSIHWSHPWPNKEFAISSRKREISQNMFLSGMEPDFLKARKIIYENESIRIFPHEYSLISAESMALYVLGIPDVEEPCHTLRPGGLSEKNLIVEIESGERRLIYDAALVDGATPSQAFRVAMGLEVLDSVEFPPIGWYECRKEYVQTFFDVEG